MKIETLYKQVRELMESCISDDEHLAKYPAADLLLSIVKDISDDAILRAIREFAEAPDAKDYQLEEMIQQAEDLDGALMELCDKCPMCDPADVLKAEVEELQASISWNTAALAKHKSFLESLLNEGDDKQAVAA